MVVFTSDHAEMAGDHWTFGKGGFFDGSYHIPLVIRDPRSPAIGTTVLHFTSAADIFPTLCERLGIEPKNSLDGQSLLPFTRGHKAENWRDAAFWEFDFRDIEHQGAEAHFMLRSSECNHRRRSGSCINAPRLRREAAVSTCASSRSNACLHRIDGRRAGQTPALKSLR
jgi:arylsulfatase A-like enzyme